MKTKELFKTTNNLLFKSGNYPIQIDPEKKWMKFKVGTCQGLWTATDKSYEILAFKNGKIGNGHFTDTMEWFEHSAKRDGLSLIIREVWNDRLKKHLIEKRGFSAINKDDVEKTFNE